MQAKHLVLISGLALTLASGPVLAQTRPGNEQDSRQRMQDRQDRLEDASRGARDRDSRFGSSTNILTSLEGIWTVNVQVNRTNWDLMNGTGQTDRRMPGQDGTVDNNNPQRRDRDGVDATNPQTNPQQPQRDREGTDRQNDRQTDRQNDRQTDGRVPQQTGTQMASADGLARSHAILGGEILRTTLIFGVDAASTTTNPGVQDRQMQERQQREQDANPARRNQEREQERTGNPDRVQPRDGTTPTTTTTTGGMMDNNALRSVSFLGYNESTGEYNLALMTANGGGIHYFTGKYDQSDRRIIFTTADRGASAATPGSRTTTNDGTTTASASGTSDLSIVLQMEGTDRYTVTAYRGTATSTGSTNPRTELGGQPAQRQDRDSNNPGQNNQERQDRTNPAMTGQDAMAPNVIYKATYTKADNTMRSQYDQIFDEREQNERRTQLRVR